MRPAASIAVDLPTLFASYVALGTSISMGVQSDGVIASTQRTSYGSSARRIGP